MGETMIVPRMFTDPLGESRFDTCEIPLSLSQHAPPAAPIFVADAASSQSHIFFRLPPKWVGDRHPTPFPCLVICLAGRFRFVGSKGEELVMNPRDKVLDFNTTGKGHTTEVLSDEAVDGLIIRF